MVLFRKHLLRTIQWNLCLSIVLSTTWGTSAARATVRQDGVDTDDPETRAEAPERPRDMPLSELPEPPSVRLAPPRPAALEAMDDILLRLVSDDSVLRERASRSLLEAKSDWVSGIERRVDRLAERSDKSAQKALLARLRKARTSPTPIESENDGSPDYLQLALAQPDPSDPNWAGLTQILALRRMLEAIGTTEAVREIIRIYVRFGEYMRIDCQRGLDALEDRALAGLIEARRHPAPKIAEWAKRRLSLLGKTSAHEAVRTKDPQALADILVALGREQNPETTRLLISFAGTEQATIRDAARQGIVLIGEAASWQLRDAYLDTTGKQPPRDWTWKRTARELFTEFDRLRLEKVYRLFQQGQEAEKAKDWDKMRAHYDKVLSLAPLFVRRDAMTQGYLAYVEHKKTESPEVVSLVLRRIERIARDEKTRAAARSERLLLEASQLKAEGFLDRTLIERAARLDPKNVERAKELLTPKRESEAWGATERYAIGISVALLSLLGATWIMVTGWWRRRERSTQPTSAR